MKRKILAVLLSVSLLLMTAAPVLGTLATEETVTPAPVETSVPTTEPETTEPTSEPTDTPETVVPMNETEPEESEQPTETEIPTGTEQPTETEIPTGTEQPTETEIPTGTEQPTETETPSETEEPDESEQPEAPAALSAVLSTDVKSAFAGEGEIAAKVTVAGGVAPYSIAFKAVNGESVKEETIVLETAGEATVTCAPAAFGTAVLSVVVTDANGASAEAGVSVPVAVRETEKKSEWEAAFENIELSGEWREDILTIARTQLGYEESGVNFVVREDGSRQGYTRYGAWYGLPYDEWCAMFASFCVNYAGIDEEYFPRSANTSAWASALNTLGAYEANDPENEENYVPQAGDLIFFQWEGEERICHVGIVETVTETTVTAIEGNSNGAVRRVEYALDSLEIAGYANLDVLIARAAEIEAAKNPEKIEEITVPDVAAGTLCAPIADETAIYALPSLQAEPMGKFGADAIFTISSALASENAVWYAVTCGEITGYIPADQVLFVETLAEETPAETVLTMQDGGFNFEISGEIPENAELYVTALGAETAANIRTNTLGEPELPEGMSEYAFDITIVADNNIWQPETPVQVEITGIDATADSIVKVFHLGSAQPAVAMLSLDEETTPAAAYEEVAATANDGSITFMADGFSVYYVVAGTTVPNDESSAHMFTDGDIYYVLPGTRLSWRGTISNPSLSPANSDCSLVTESSRLVFVAPSNASLETYKVTTDEGTVTVYVVDASTLISGVLADSKYPVYLTGIKDSSSLPNEPMSGGWESWQYIKKDSSSNTGYSIQYNAKFANDASDTIKPSIANDQNLKQAIDGTNTIGIVDSGWGADTLKYVNLTEDEWHKILVTLANIDDKFFGYVVSEGVVASNGVRVTEDNVEEKIEHADGTWEYKYYIYPYVIKLITDNDGDTGWHIDCCVVARDRVMVAYDFNLGEGVAIDISKHGNVQKPNTKYYNKGDSSVTAGSITDDNSAITSLNVSDENGDYIYTFKEWNTQPDGSGTTYAVGASLGELTEDVTLYAIWTSAGQTSGTLQIGKTVDASQLTTEGAAALANVSYTFTVNFNSTDADKELYYNIYKDGSQVNTDGVLTLKNGGTVVLKDGEYATILRVPNGAVTIVETVPADADFKPSWGADNKTATYTGEITGGNLTIATCTNTYEAKLADLTITKTDMTNDNPTWENAIFNVAITKADGTKIQDYTVAIPTGKSVTIADLPIGSTYTITEVGSWSWRYSGKTAEGMIQASGSNVTIANTKSNSQWLSDEGSKINNYGGGVISNDY